MSSEFLAGLSDLADTLPQNNSPPGQKEIHIKDFLNCEVGTGKTRNDFEQEMHQAFRGMLDTISPTQNKVEDMEPTNGLYEHLGFLEPEIKNDETYHRLVQAVKDSPHWAYSGPNRIEPVQAGLVDLVQLQGILDKFDYGEGDFFRGSITLWGSYEHGTDNHMFPNHLSVYYVEREQDRFVLIHKVLKE